MNHAFMPIVIEAVPFDEFIGWVEAGQLVAEEEARLEALDPCPTCGRTGPLGGS